MDGSSWYKIGEVVGYATAGFVIACVIKLYAHFKGKKKDFKFDFNKMSATDIRLIELLSGLRVTTGADRVHLYRFHNGGDFIDGSPIKKVSCTHETVATGISHEIAGLQNIQCSINLSIIQMLSSGNNNIVYTDSLQDSFLKSNLVSKNVKAFVVTPIYKQSLASSSMIIGYLKLHFCNLDNIPEENGKKVENIDIAKECAKLVSVELLKE